MTRDRFADKFSASSRRWRNARLLVLGVPVLAGGCANGFKWGVLDPAPYNPVSESCLAAAGGKVSLPFKTFDDAAKQLCTLGADYADKRNILMRQRLALDLPALGLGVASAANGAFRGAKDLTLALGIGGAGLAGVTSYFSPQTRITAYSGAAKGLLCAGSISYLMAQEDSIDRAAAQAMRGTLFDDTQAATDLIAGGTLTTKDPASLAAAHDLIAARDGATKAAGDLEGGFALLQSGPAKLQGFAIDVTNSATTGAMTGAQNVTAVLTLVKTQIGSLSAPSANPSGAAPTGLAAAHVVNLVVTPKGTSGSQTAAELTAKLNADAKAAEDIVKRIGDAWSGFASCTPV